MEHILVAVEGDEGEEIEHGFGVAIMNRICESMETDKG